MKQSKFWLLFSLITILAFIACSLQSKAADTTRVTTSVVYNDIKHVVSTSTPKIEQAVSSIAKDLKVTVDQVWNILVRQQKVWSYCFLLLTISALTNWYLFYKKNFNVKYEKVLKTNSKYMPKDGATGKDRDYYSQWRDIQEEELVIIPNSSIPGFKYLHLAICITLSIFSYMHFAQMLTGFMNPEYGAMQTIAEIAQHLGK